MRREWSWILCVAALGFAVGSIARPGAADAQATASRQAMSYTYFPKGGAQGIPELVDTRTGAIYRRNDFSNRWELFTKAVGQE
jgi:hypothetical protein